MVTVTVGVDVCTLDGVVFRGSHDRVTEDGVNLLLRVEGQQGYSFFVLARSEDGLDFIVDAVTPGVRDFLLGAAPPQHLSLKDRAMLYFVGHVTPLVDFFKARRAYAAVRSAPSSTSTL